MKRTRKEIESDYINSDFGSTGLLLEVLLDIRDLLEKDEVSQR